MIKFSLTTYTGVREAQNVYFVDVILELKTWTKFSPTIRCLTICSNKHELCLLINIHT